MFRLLNDIGWGFSIIAIIGALIMYIYEKITKED
jgi:hypothetical protein